MRHKKKVAVKRPGLKLVRTGHRGPPMNGQPHGQPVCPACKRVAPYGLGGTTMIHREDALAAAYRRGWEDCINASEAK